MKRKIVLTELEKLYCKKQGLIAELAFIDVQIISLLQQKDKPTGEK